MVILKDFEMALSEITSNAKISFLGTARSKSDLDSTVPEYPNPETNGEAATQVSAIDFKWSDISYLIRDEIALLAQCESAALDADTSIFTLGLDSIDAIKLSSRLKLRAVNISVSMIMRNATIRQMTQASKALESDANRSPNLRLEEYERQLSTYLRRNGFPMENIEAVLPPTPIQEAIFADTSTTTFSRYLNQEIFLIRSSVDNKKLELAWETVIAESPILRTSSVVIDDPDIPFSYAQVIHRPGQSGVRHVNKEPSDSLDALMENVMKHDRRMALDNVPFGITFVHNITESYLVLTLSHALYDGVSLALLHHDIFDAYYDRYSSRPSNKGTLEHILSSSDARASRYWTEYISGATPCSFLSQVPKPLSRFHVNRLQRRSSVSATDIRSFIKSQGISVQALGQVCWALLLAYFLKSLEVTFGVILSGRDTEQSNEVMLPTMNTVVVRSVIGGSMRQMLQDMQGSCANAIQYQHFPLRKTLAAVKKTDQSLFDSLFLVQRKLMVLPTDEQLYDSIGGDSSVEVITFERWWE
jgi:aryl carrier-like protein